MIFDKVAFLHLKATSLPGTLVGGFLLLRHAQITTADHKSDGRWLPKEKKLPFNDDLQSSIRNKI